MSICKTEWDYERKKLEEVLFEIHSQLEDSIDTTKNFKSEVIATQKKMWEDVKCAPQDMKDLDGVAISWQYQVEISNQNRKYQFAKNILARLNKMRLSPYFGRIDFHEEGEDALEQIYIGIHNLTGEKTSQILVYDWRAPISSMFYDNELGKSQYTCPAGIICGNMHLKRQYKILSGSIQYMFDSSLRIDDDILQEILSKSVDNKMKTIVNSIQREQNGVIRDDIHKLLIVQGSAGSGKTSIALHRIAYLLYKYRDSINSDNIVIFSPNQVFNDYISNVLPELGENNMYQTTFIEYAQEFLKSSMVYEDMSGQIEYLLSSRNSKEYETRIKSIEYKTSPQFISILKNYIKYLEESGVGFYDLVYKDKVVISKQEILSLFKGENTSITLCKRLEKVKNRLMYLLEHIEYERIKSLKNELYENDNFMSDSEIRVRSKAIAKNEFNCIKMQIEEMTTLDYVKIYIELFKNNQLFTHISDEGLPEYYHDISSFTFKNFENCYIPYEDIIPILFLKGALDSKPNTNLIKHVIIDEAQDYTPLQYEIIRQLFGNCSLTLLGDLNQSINSYMNIGVYEIIPEIFNNKSTSFIRLSKSYRSTAEISSFCKSILGTNVGIEFLNRKGEKPKIIRVLNDNILSKTIASDINGLISNGFKSIAVICKTASHSLIVYNKLKKHIDVNLITKNDIEYTKGVVVVPSYLSKGLEFDGVLICCVSEQDYCFEDERRLLYTACSRALHILHLFYIDKLSHFILDIDPQLYDALSY